MPLNRTLRNDRDGKFYVYFTAIKKNRTKKRIEQKKNYKKTITVLSY